MKNPPFLLILSIEESMLPLDLQGKFLLPLFHLFLKHRNLTIPSFYFSLESFYDGVLLLKFKLVFLSCRSQLGSGGLHLLLLTLDFLSQSLLVLHFLFVFFQQFVPVLSNLPFFGLPAVGAFVGVGCIRDGVAGEAGEVERSTPSQNRMTALTLSLGVVRKEIAGIAHGLRVDHTLWLPEQIVPVIVVVHLR